MTDAAPPPPPPPPPPSPHRASHAHVQEPGRRPEVAAALASVAATVVVASSFLPWVETGAHRRSSYDLVTSARRLELLDGLAAELVQLWFFAPAVVGVAWLAIALGRPAAGATLCGLVGLWGAVLALLTVRSPLVHQPGATLTGWVGLFAITAAVGGWLPRRSSRARPDVIGR